MIITQIQNEIKENLKAKNELRLSTMRMLLSALKYAQIDKMRELTEQEELDIVKKEAKKRQDAISLYEQAKEQSRADQERAELAILKELLPPELTDEEISELTHKAIEIHGNDFGLVMKEVVDASHGRADGRRINEIVRASLH